MSDKTPRPQLDLSPLPGKQTGGNLPDLVGLMQRLLAPSGCPWDREQTLESLLPYLVEETYEVVDALHAGDVGNHVEELGDLLLQIVFQAELRHMDGAFGIDDVVRGIVAKLVRRHPHVFGESDASTSGEVLRNWEALKAAERSAAGKDRPGEASMLDSVSKSLPAVMEAYQMTTKAGRVGFDWPNARAALDKLDEESLELRDAVATGDAASVEEEIGDLLFVLVNVARLSGTDPESALKAANRKFRRRFRHIEDGLRARGKTPAESTLPEMDALWDEAKSRER